MSTCKDCLHYEVCQYHITEETDMTVNECSYGFKNKADYVEVKYGEWLKTKEPLGWQDVDCIECSVCHDSYVIDDLWDFDECSKCWNFCPTCGVKMNGKRKESEVQGELHLKKLNE